MPPAEIIIPCRAAPMRVRLSVLIPFLRHDPSPLLERLGHRDVEIVLLDDGTACPELTARVAAAAELSLSPTRLIVWDANRGRSAARNRLIEEARGEYVLFLDADMIPDAPDFLSRWLESLD